MKSYAAMVVIEIAYGGSNVLVKLALDKGLNQFVFMVYRHLVALFMLAPFAFFLERKQRPQMSAKLMGKIFVVASLGTTIHLNVYYAGIAYTSATVASALSNVIPALTFFMAFLLGMEKVKMRSGRGWSKVLGTMICIGGSMIFTFWKGGFVYKSIPHTPLLNFHFSNSYHNHNWIKGSALILTSQVAWSAWLILQGLIYEIYPARLSFTALMCFFTTIQSSILSLFFARNPALWKVDWNVQLLTIIYCGIVISGLVYYLQIWCISKKGPVFVAMFSPLILIIVGIFSAIAFAERLHLGSLIGAFLIIVGLYGVLWGKWKDETEIAKSHQIEEDKHIHVVVDSK